MAQFEEGDVVTFADGNGNMLLWGDKVNITEMFVTSVEGDMVNCSSHPYTFQFEADKLVKIGHRSDTHYNSEGNEVETWFPELYEDDEAEEVEGD